MGKSSSSQKKPAKEERTNDAVRDNEEDDDNDEESIIPDGSLPMYLTEAFGELYAQDGLIVLGKGLGWLNLLAAFVRFYAEEPPPQSSTAQAAAVASINDNSNNDSIIIPSKKRPLVLVLGLRDNERNALVSTLESWGTPPNLLPTMVTNETGQGKDRAVMYLQGGTFCITSRILIVDLLSNIIKSNHIDGMLVAHAHNVTEQSTEAFILRIFHSQKSNNTSAGGFVKAFTDKPEAVRSGFAKVDKILKALRVKRLLLYPRFHDIVRQELEHKDTAIQVQELRQALSPLMQEIQTAIVAAMQSCIRELKQSTTLLEWAETDLSIENCVTTNFERAISKQLEQDWHRLKPQTKQYIQDLKTLRTLFESLIQYDCVAFWKLINAIKTYSATSRHPSMWLLSPAADIIFRKAKERIYKISRRPPTATIPNPVAKLKPILEENPKWKLLKTVLQEIKTQEATDARCRHHRPVSVLVMIKDDKTLEDIRSYLVDGKSRAMTIRWLRFLEQFNDRSRSVAKTKGGISAISEESRLLLEEEGRAKRLLFGKETNPATSINASASKANSKKAPPPLSSTASTSGRNKRGGKELNAVPDYVRKRRRIAAEKSRGRLTSQADDLERSAVLEEALEQTEHEIRDHHHPAGPIKDKNNANDDDVDNENPINRDERVFDDEMFDVTISPGELRIVLKSYGSIEYDHGALFLQDVRPSYVILYDAEISFVRSLEVYSALHSSSDQRLQVYFLIFEASAEEKTFTKSIERERAAFEHLIHHKKHMPAPVLHNVESQEMQLAHQKGNVGGSYSGGSLPLAFDSRRGLGKEGDIQEMRDIAVDVREFRSALPSILHQGGMRLAPVTLTVGDFVLSSVHCVERKSISDLFGSLNSGRLYTQAQAMVKHYKCPCLLIEFDPNKSFGLQNVNDLGLEIRSDSICSKLSLLVMHFPQLRILWSKGPHETLGIFKALKVNHGEVDVEKAIEAGRNESLDSIHDTVGCKDDEEEDEINEMAKEMLLRLPGVTVASARKIMNECDSLAELAQLSKERLREVAGPLTGQKLFKFFNQPMGAL